MKKIKRLVAIVLCSCMILSMCACDSKTKEEKEISKTLDNFVTAYVDMDIQGMLDCIDPGISNLVGAVGGLLDDLVGIDMDTVLSLVSAFAYIETIEDRDALNTLKMDVDEIDLEESGAYATVTCTLSYKDNGQIESETMDVYMIKKDGKWYISEQ